MVGQIIYSRWYTGQFHLSTHAFPSSFCLLSVSVYLFLCNKTQNIESQNYIFLCCTFHLNKTENE